MLRKEAQSTPKTPKIPPQSSEYVYGCYSIYPKGNPHNFKTPKGAFRHPTVIPPPPACAATGDTTYVVIYPKGTPPNFKTPKVAFRHLSS